MSPARRPKVELHLNLEGAAPPALIRGLGGHVDLGGLFTADGRYAWQDYPSS